MKEVTRWTVIMHALPSRIAASVLLTTLAIFCGRSPCTAIENQVDSPKQSDIDFFEKKIRPVLVTHCYQCHSLKAKKVQGGLLLDSRTTIRRGGDSGPAVVPGNIDKSLLIGAIRYQDLEMPPRGRLAKAVVADFVKWIESGAADPRQDVAATVPNTGLDYDAARRTWTYRTPLRHQPPTVDRRDWPKGAVDRFVLARLEERGLAPVEDAARHALIRRLSLDLIGLPPSPQEIERYVEDESGRALEKVVDRLLASDHFGEHWGRHWLDVARYADSNGGDINLTFHNAWRYRDYVIDAFNSDKPFDQFIVEQVAGDLMSYQNDEQRIEQLVASGFLVIGPKMLSERDKEKLLMDVVDEQIDTVGRVFFGLTLGCARCHDHKFDPISTRDYYALAGIFRSTITVQGIRMKNVNVSGWIERRLPMKPADERALADYLQRAGRLEKQITQIKAKQKRRQTTPTVDLLPGIVVDDVDATLVGTWKRSTHVARFVGQGYVHDENSGKGQKSITFTPDLPKSGEYEVRISYASSRGRASNVPVSIRYADGRMRVDVNQERLPPVDGLFQPIGRFYFNAGKQGSVTITNDDTTRFVIADAAQFIPINELRTESIRANRKSDLSPAAIAELTGQIKELERQLAQLKATAPASAPMTMAVKDRDNPMDCQIRVRGNPNQHGAMVPRGFLSVAQSPAEPPAIHVQQSGRAELARWIADANHPLTARVIVNRVWHHLFGTGLVVSVDNFGRQGARPSHPELLDWLAVDFVEDGWSIKRTVKNIVLSRAYQLSTRHNDAGLSVDPQNLLLWRHNRRRLAAEAIRDAILFSSGALDRRPGGSSVADLGEQAIANNSQDKTQSLNIDGHQRRSVYLPIVRNNTPDFLTVFDFADPDVTVGARSVTTVPAQSLLMLNSAFVRRHALRLAERAFQVEHQDDSRRLNFIYTVTVGRPPTDSETARAFEYLSRSVPVTAGIGEPPASADVAAWAQFCHALFASTEFRFTD